MDKNDKIRWLDLKIKWDKVIPGMTLLEAESIMGFKFRLDSLNKTGRMVYSNHSQDYLPFYLIVDQSSGRIIRRHSIRALDEAYANNLSWNISKAFRALKFVYKYQLFNKLKK